MTTNGNIYRNFLKYFAKKHLGFGENLSGLCGTLGFRGPQFKKNRYIYFLFLEERGEMYKY